MWKQTNNFEQEIGLLINNLVLFKDKLLSLNPWIPFPSNATSFTFGKDNKTLPIGALYHLWSTFEPFTGICQSCSAFGIYGYGFYWCLSSGGISGCCIRCSAQHINMIDGQLISKDLTNLLKPTPFYLSRWGFLGSTYKASRRELIEVLKELGVSNLPDENWINKKEKPIREINFKK